MASRLTDDRPTEAFILGAGFSRAIHDSMPLVAELREPLDDYLGSSRGTAAATFPRLENVELFLTSLAEPQPFLDESANHYNQGLFVETTRWLARHVFAAQQHALGSPLPPWLAGLVRAWHEHRSTVITLNYDTLVESAVMSLELGDLTKGKVMPHFAYANPVRFSASDWQGIANPYERRQPTFTLCKLHGSLSWWRSGPVHQAPVDVQTWTDTFDGLRRASWDDVAGRVMTGEPMLVPPTFAKSGYFDNDVIRANWRRAFEGLSTATTIVVMGYSMPAGDVQTAALLGSVTRTRPQDIVVVDLSPDVRSRVAQAALPRTGIVSHFGDTDQPIHEWATRWAADPRWLYAGPEGSR